MRYRYAGPGPQDDGEGGIVRPGDVRELESCDWGPWEPVEDEPAPAPPAPPAPAPAADVPADAAKED